MNIFSTILALVKLAPDILALIAAVEMAFGAGNGPAKKEVVMSAVAGLPPELTTAISTLVDHVVAVKKTAGVTVPVVATK